MEADAGFSEVSHHKLALIVTLSSFICRVVCRARAPLDEEGDDVIE